MKVFIITLTALFAIGSFTYSQTDTTMTINDTLIIITSYKYDSAHNFIEPYKKCTSQKTSDTKGIDRRNIFFEANSGKISKFIYYYHNEDGNLISEEVYKTEGEIDYIIEYTYSNNTLHNKTTYRIAGDKLQFAGDTTFKYKNNQLISYTSRNADRKKTSTTKIKYNENTKTTTFKPTKVISNSEGIKIIVTTEVFQGDSLLNSTKRTDYLTGKSITIKESVKFKNNLPVEKVTTDIASNQKVRIEYDYYPDKTPKNTIVYRNDQKVDHFYNKREQTVMNYAGYNCVLHKFKE